MGYIFKNIVESSSNGAIKVELYPNSQLGDNKASMEMVMDGSLEACIETGVIPGIYPEFQVISIPYLFKSPEIAWYVFDNSKYWADLKKDFTAKTGMRLLSMGQNGVRHFSHSSKVFKTPADLKGEKIRVMQSPIFVKMMEAFGANAVPMAWSELYTSLQTGVVSGQENPISVVVANNLQEVQQYITLDGHLWSEDGFLMNEAFFQSLPKVFQDIILQAARQAEATNRGIETIHSNGPGFEKLVNEGINIYVPSMSEKQAFADVAQPPVVEYLKEEIGDSAVDGMLNAVKDAEAALGY